MLWSCSISFPAVFELVDAKSLEPSTLSLNYRFSAYVSEFT